MVLTQFDVLLACLAVVVAVSLLCKAGKLIVWWVICALVLFAVINVLFNVLSGGDKWGLVPPEALIEGSRRAAGESLYETVVSSEAFSLTINAVKDWSKEDKLPPPPPANEASSGWQFPWG